MISCLLCFYMKNMTRSFLLSAFLFLAGDLVFAQGTYMPSNAPSVTAIRGVNVNQGTLAGMGLKYNDGSYVNEKNADIKGSPFFKEDWLAGNVLLRTKDRFDSVFIKYDLYRDLLLVKVDEKEYEFNIDVWEFTLPGSADDEKLLFRSGFEAAPGMTDKSFYQVLYDGKTKFLLKHRKQIVSEMTSTPGVRARAFEDQKQYFILKPGGRMDKLRKKNKSILDLLGDAPELEKKIAAGKMKFNSDEDIIAVLKLYDSLEKD